MKMNTKLVISICVIILGIIVMLIVFKNVNQIYKNKIEITYKNEVNANNEYTVTFKYNDEKIKDILCSIDGANYKKIEECTYYLTSGKHKIYLKKDDSILTQEFEIKPEYLGTFTSTIDVLDTYYLAVGGKKRFNFTFDYPSNFDKEVYYKVEDDSILKIEDDKMYGLKEGTTKVTATLKDGNSKTYEVMVTDLIVSPTMAKKTRLTCNKYTLEESELLDKILASRVQEAGIGTRAGVAAAARFLSLEFPYAIRYFYENGRLENWGTKAHVDAEGRYYHVGLYLHESKFSEITASSKDGPAIWGCDLMEYSKNRMGVNGLDCSGFVTWAMLNGGFDSKDVGSGNEVLIDGELYDYGTHNEITKEYMEGNTYKPGDYIASDGHAALIVGVDEKYVYVAEAYYADVKVSKFEKFNELPNLYSLTFITEMDEIYPNGDGNITLMWE